MQALCDEHAGAEAGVDTGGEFNFTAAIADQHGIAFGDIETSSVFWMDENRRFALALEAAWGLVEG